MDKETQFADEIIQQAKERGINICIFIAREDGTFHYKLHSNSSNPTAAICWSPM